MSEKVFTTSEKGVLMPLGGMSTEHWAVFEEVSKHAAKIEYKSVRDPSDNWECCQKLADPTWVYRVTLSNDESEETVEMSNVFGFRMVDGTTEVNVGDILSLVEPSENAEDLDGQVLVKVVGEGRLECVSHKYLAWSRAGCHGYAMYQRQESRSDPIGTITDIEEMSCGGLRASYNSLTQKGRIIGETPAPDDYAPLRAVLDAAFDQAAKGKGKERHANDKPFDRQPLLEISRMVGVGGPAYQVMKKTQEAVGMFNRGQHAAARAEMLGAINYAAAMVMLIEESDDD